jgi:hypothetical protein
MGTLLEVLPFCFLASKSYVTNIKAIKSAFAQLL